MHIGLDIDETLVLHKNRDIKYGLEFAKAFNVEYRFVNGKDIKDGIEIDWTEDNLNKFWQSSFGKNFYKYAILTNPNRCVIETLQKRGHKIYLITSRNPIFFQTTQKN